MILVTLYSQVRNKCFVVLVIFTKKKNIDFRKKAFVSNLNQSMIFSSSQDSKSPDCCGSDTQNIQPTLLETGPFDRRAAAGSFLVSSTHFFSNVSRLCHLIFQVNFYQLNDGTPPGRVTDLLARYFSDRSVDNPDIYINTFRVPYSDLTSLKT